jgi:hypothetical protein
LVARPAVISGAAQKGRPITTVLAEEASDQEVTDHYRKDGSEHRHYAAAFKLAMTLFGWLVI